MPHFLPLLGYVLVGFLAQMIDGSLGMAYGVSSTTFLKALGVPSAAASASVHTAEVFTTLVSGVSHWKMKNIDKKLLLTLVVPGVIGGALGAFVLSSYSTDFLEPFIDAYLIVMGIIILIRAFVTVKKTLLTGWKIVPVGLAGGLLDAMGGGGWGPVVTSTMVATGHPPRYVIGSVNTAEFFVTVVQALTFTVFLGIGDYWQIILCLAIGGVLAAPLAAYLCTKLPTKTMMVVVGCVIVGLNIYNLITCFI